MGGAAGAGVRGGAGAGAARMAVADEGLAAERTALAWQRTALSFVALAALLGRAGVLHGSPAGWAGAAICLLAALGLTLGGRRAYERGAVEGAAARALPHAAVAACGVAGALAALAVVLGG